VSLPVDNKPVENQRYTFTDYYSWDDGKRWELIDGIPYEMHVMSPAPSRTHQWIVGQLHLQLASFFKGKPGEVYIAPFDVRLNSDNADDIVVQPDIVVVCDSSMLNEKGCKGAPDMVIEVLSQSTARHDRLVKFRLYQNAGVREYWIVDPDSRTVSAHVLENGKYIVTPYGDEGSAPVHVLEGFEIKLPEVFG